MLPQNKSVLTPSQNSTQTWDTQYKEALNYPYMLVPGQSMPAEGGGNNSDSDSSSNTSSSGKHGLSKGAIAGIAVAGAVFLGILVALFFVLGRNRVYSQWMTSQDGRTERTARWALFNHDDRTEYSNSNSNSNRKSEVISGVSKPGNVDVSAMSSPDPTVRTFSPGSENISRHGSPSAQQTHWSWNEPPPVRSYRPGVPTELEGHPMIYEAPASPPGDRF
jgi:hypothetical protein